MIKIKNITIILLIIIGSMAYIGTAFEDPIPEPDIIGIKVAPATFDLNKEGPLVTVHADILFNEVNTDTLELDNIPPIYTFSDDCGNLVAKFDPALIKEKIVPPEATLTLTGETKTEGSFIGSDTVQVIDPTGKR
jgi:hypothetical protein